MEPTTQAVERGHTSHGAAVKKDVVVIGGGQAGLAMGYFLAQQGRDFTILEAAAEPGAAWRQRWDSLKLFTPARYSSLPGFPFPGEPDHYPMRDEVVAYLADYAHRFQLPIEVNRRVRSITRPDAAYFVSMEDRAYVAEQVVVATGPFQMPFVPAIADRLDPGVVQLHSTTYHAPGDLPMGKTLVVGGGNTGFQIAKELSESREVHLSVGARQMPLPQRIMGRDIFWYLEGTRLIYKTTESRIGRRMAGRDTLIGSRPRTLRRRYGVRLHGRAADANGRTVHFDDGERVEPDAVIWATGFRADFSWINLPVFDDMGRVVHRRGVTDAPGLYFLGLSWLHTRGSALIGWVKDDAEYLAQQIANLKTPADTTTSEPVGGKR